MSKRQIEEPLINLTPLIDVVFVVLIMFIVMVPLLELDRIQLANGRENETNKRAVQESSPLVIHVHADNTIFFLGKPILLNQLTAVLKKAKKEHPQALLQLFHDKLAHFGTYQSIKNAAEDAGFSHLDLILKPS